jgi:hypothetical protein
LGNEALRDAPLKESCDNNSKQNECSPNGGNPRGLRHGHAKGFGTERFEQNILTKDSGEEQKQINKE